MWLLDYMCKVNTSQNINHTIFVRQENMVYLDRRTEEHVFFIKTREQKNMFLFRQKNMFFIKTREHENKREG